jgi:2,4-dienoyl-CoA reductase-like NADH-dependent reductase (Old Yellow Enzyme family)
MGIRISSVDWVEGGTTIEDAVAFAKELKKLGCDYVDVSSGQVDLRQKIPFAPGYNAPFAEKVRREADIPTMTVGLITQARQAEEIVASGQADLIAIARGALYDPRWAWHAAEELGVETEYPPRGRAAHPSMRPQVFPNRAAKSA